MMQSVVLSVLMVSVLATWLVVVDAYPSGPPLLACTSMVPTGHGTSTLSGETPFTITTNTTFYTAGEQIEVTISGARFVGFFVQARRRDAGSDTSKGVGTMTPGNTAIGKTLDCDGGTANAWSHKTNAAKTSENAIWTASSNEGKIAFRATIVQGPSSDRYWTDIYSADLPFGSAPADDTTGQTTPITGSAHDTTGQTTPITGSAHDTTGQTTPITGSAHVYGSSLPLLLVSCAVAAMNRL